MATGALDANGVWQYGEDDQLAAPTWSAYMNKLAGSTSTVVGGLKARIDDLADMGAWLLPANLSVASGVFTLLTCTTPIAVSPGAFSNSGGAIAVTENGLYEVHVQALWAGGAGVRRSITVTRNGPSFNAGGVLNAGGTVIAGALTPPTGSVAEITQAFRSRRVLLTAGDVLRVFVFHDAGANLNVMPGASNNFLGQTTIDVYRVG